jgi:hypothetical protein
MVAIHKMLQRIHLKLLDISTKANAKRVPAFAAEQCEAALSDPYKH